MIDKIKSKKQLIYGLGFIITVLPFILGYIIPKTTAVQKTQELYEPSLGRLNSMDKMELYCDSLYAVDKRLTFDTAKYVHVVSKTVKRRFFHGLLDYSFSDNWITYLAGKAAWSHLLAIVDPDDILKHPYGLCSQQTIIFMEVLKRKKINVRSLGLGKTEGPGHFLCEVNYNGAWHLYDVTLEPKWKASTHKHESMSYYKQYQDTLYQVYSHRFTKEAFYNIANYTTYGSVNAFPAKKMLFFHRVTKTLTYILPLFFLICYILSSRKKRLNNTTSTSATTSNAEVMKDELELV